MVQLLKKVVFIISSVAYYLMMSSCSNNIDYIPYSDPQLDSYTQSWTEQFGTNIDPNHNWNTSSAAAVTVTANAAGTVYILTNSAFSGEGNYVYLAANTIRYGQTATLNIDLPQNLKDSTLYAAIYTEAGYINEKPFVIQDGKATVNFLETYTAESSNKAKAAPITRGSYDTTWTH